MHRSMLLKGIIPSSITILCNSHCITLEQAAEEIVFKPEGAVHENVRKAYNRGQETMPWEDVETIVNASVFITGK